MKLDTSTASSSMSYKVKQIPKHGKYIITVESFWVGEFYLSKKPYLEIIGQRYSLFPSCDCKTLLLCCLFFQFVKEQKWISIKKSKKGSVFFFGRRFVSREKKPAFSQEPHVIVRKAHPSSRGNHVIWSESVGSGVRDERKHCDVHNRRYDQTVSNLGGKTSVSLVVLLNIFPLLIFESAAC